MLISRNLFRIFFLLRNCLGQLFSTLRYFVYYAIKPLSLCNFFFILSRYTLQQRKQQLHRRKYQRIKNISAYLIRCTVSKPVEPFSPNLSGDKQTLNLDCLLAMLTLQAFIRIRNVFLAIRKRFITSEWVILSSYKVCSNQDLLGLRCLQNIGDFVTFLLLRRQ